MLLSLKSQLYGSRQIFSIQQEVWYDTFETAFKVLENTPRYLYYVLISGDDNNKLISNKKLTAQYCVLVLPISDKWGCIGVFNKS